ncbi:hypothetical protein PMG11_04568 [Penicillium brasilianum]|uniref:SprT-like domain-containing protein n=1 Tax=Penicillium brasilianum TaxID=104259 RepID=A0A0F7VD75_PENBI|nr:hypothetical protein PMG11_04568 [Penicillium brasilianum]
MAQLVEETLLQNHIDTSLDQHNAEKTHTRQRDVVFSLWLERRAFSSGARKPSPINTGAASPTTMARLNTTNPLTTAIQRKKSLKERTERLPAHKSIADEPRTNIRSSNGSSRSKMSGASSQRNSRGSSAIFDIFSDDSPIIESSNSSPRKQKKTRTLKAANVNSLLLPIGQTPRQRPMVKLETDDFEKENDIMENTPERYTATREAPPQASPTRRNMAGIPRISRPDNTPLSPQRSRSPESETEEDCGDNSFNSLEDFIVSDNEDPSFHATSNSETEDEKALSPPPPPKSTRKRLMRGRRPDADVGKISLKDESFKASFRLEAEIPGIRRRSSSTEDSPRPVSQEGLNLSTKLKSLDLNGDNVPLSHLETKSARSIIELDCSPKILRPTSKKLETPPSSPKQARLRSPTKSKIRIPATPHRENVDAFWSQEETNTWNDQYSPRKEKSSSRTVIELLQDFDDSEEEELVVLEEDRSRESSSSSDIEIIPKMNTSVPTTPKPLSKTAMKKAEAEKNRAAKARRQSFNNKKADFAQTFFNALDQAASGGEVSRLAEPTGGVKITWSKTLNRTAGRAHWRGERVVSHGPNGETRGFSKTLHHATIELAEKIIDDEYRLINTLAHEYCHLANYMVSNVHDNPHGASFKSWGKKCTEAMKNHPVYGGQITVTTKHTYQIDYKYVWNCMTCGQEYCRHSKSIDTQRSRCGACRGALQQTKPKPRNVSPKKSTATPGQRKILDDVTKNLDEFVF